MVDNQKYLSVKEAAQIVGISPNSFRKHLLPTIGIRIGRRILIRPESLEFTAKDFPVIKYCEDKEVKHDN